MEPTLVFTGIVIGVVEAIQAAYDRKWKVVATICGAGTTGGFLGLVAGSVVGLPAGVEGAVIGIALGLAASGAVTVAKKV